MICRRSEKKSGRDSSREFAVFNVALVFLFREVGELAFIQRTVQSRQFVFDLLKLCHYLLYSTVEEKFLLE